jgi:nondiscriminating glutamyl-tRNA synthetase
MFRTRQAPSPTGYLHFGTARTMLFTQLLAIAKSGIWYLRIEDTDRNRLQPEAVGSLLDSMLALGLLPQEGVNPQKNGTKDSFYNIYQTGSFGPYIQSERLSLYHKYANQLLESKQAYWSYLNTQDKELLQELKKLNKQPINFYQANLQKVAGAELTEASIQRDQSAELEKIIYQSVDLALKDERKPDLRFKIQGSTTLETADFLLGKISFNLALEEDFTILKSDSYPTYHFAHAIDDKLMETSLVIRAQEWLSSLPKHICLTQALWKTSFDYLHLPFILGETGNKKMSKRDGNVNMQDYLEKGYLPEAIVNYLAFLGWHPATTQEIFLEQDAFLLDSKSRMEVLMRELSLNFDIDKLSKSPARFNIEKLNWFNQCYTKCLCLEEFCKLAKVETNLAYLLDQERVTLYTEQMVNSKMILDYQKPNFEQLAFKGATNEQTLANLATLKPIILEVLEKNQALKDTLVNTFKEKPNSQLLKLYTNVYKSIETDLKEALKSKELAFGPYLFPLRVALSGQSQSPSPFELLAILDTQTILDRLAI